MHKDSIPSAYGREGCRIYDNNKIPFYGTCLPVQIIWSPPAAHWPTDNDKTQVDHRYLKMSENVRHAVCVSLRLWLIKKVWLAPLSRVGFSRETWPCTSFSTRLSAFVSREDWPCTSPHLHRLSAVGSVRRFTTSNCPMLKHLTNHWNVLFACDHVGSSWISSSRRLSCIGCSWSVEQCAAGLTNLFDSKIRSPRYLLPCTLTVKNTHRSMLQNKLETCSKAFKVFIRFCIYFI